MQHRLLMLAAILLAARLDAVAGDLTGPATTKNGDDLLIAGHDVRLYGIDAFESGQECEADGQLYPCGRQAEHALAAKITNGLVTCEPRYLDARRRRPVALCRIRGEDLNAWMVNEGWALAYRRFSLDYVGEEDVARLAGRGVWRGAFVPPWEWRRGKRLPQEVAMQRIGALAECVVKGNVSRTGERIYHVSGQRYYDQTGIDASRGEHWFCTEEEAQSAGWRRAKR